jgi:predicted  nucleic acid-binding Zn-ribbon protein
MAPTRPVQYPDWALQDITDATSGQPNVEQPDALHSGSGVDSSDDPILPSPPTIEGVKYYERTPRRWFNWLMRTQSYWVRWLDKITQDNKTSITTLDGEMDTAQSNIQSNTTSINSLNSSVSTINGTLGSHGTAISSLQSQVGTNTSDIATHDSHLSTIDGQVSTLQTAAATALATNNTQDGNIGNLQSRMSTAESTNNTQDSNIGSLTSGLSTTNGDLSTLTGRVSATEGVNNTQDTTLNGHTNSINSLTGRASSLEGRMGTAESNITNLQGRMNTAESTNTTQNSNISTLQGQMSTAQGNISNLQGRMNTTESTDSTQNSNISTLQGQASTALSTNNTQDSRLNTLETNSGCGSGYSGTALATRTSTLESTSSTLVTATGSVEQGSLTVHFGQYAGSWQFADNANPANPVDETFTLRYKVVVHSGFSLITLVFPQFAKNSYSGSMVTTTQLPASCRPQNNVWLCNEVIGGVIGAGQLMQFGFIKIDTAGTIWFGSNDSTIGTLVPRGGSGTPSWTNMFAWDPGHAAVYNKGFYNFCITYPYVI